MYRVIDYSINHLFTTMLLIIQNISSIKYFNLLRNVSTTLIYFILIKYKNYFSNSSL